MTTADGPMTFQFDPPITFAFLRRYAKMMWQDLDYGLSRGLIDATVPVDKAVENLLEDRVSCPAVAELATLSGRDRFDIADIVRRLADKEPPQPADEEQRKWLFLVLAWLYEHRHDFEQPLDMVSTVYADFGYPDEVKHFVPYMPMIGPDLGSRSANESRLYERWRDYLERRQSEELR